MRTLLFSPGRSVLPLLGLHGRAASPILPGQRPCPLPQPSTIRSWYPTPNAQYVFDTAADVIGDYFTIDHEEPVRLLGTTLTEARIDTYPKVGATVFEPWDHDSADGYQRLESTLQSIRRYAVIKVVPTPRRLPDRRGGVQGTGKPRATRAGHRRRGHLPPRRARRPAWSIRCRSKT